MVRDATPEEKQKIRMDAIQFIANRYGLSPDKRATELDYTWGNSKEDRFKVWRENKKFFILIRSFYLERQEELGVSINIPSVEEQLEIAEEAYSYAQARYLSAKKFREEKVQNGGEVKLFQSPEEYIFAFGEDTVIFLTGRCGAGKSTLVNKLKKALAKTSYWVTDWERFFLQPLTSITVADPDDNLTEGEWVGIVPTEMVEPAWRETLKKINSSLKIPSGITVIPDAGDNQAAREAILVAIQSSHIARNVHYVLADCPPLEALARNETRERKVSYDVWLRVHERVNETFESVTNYLKSSPDRYFRHYTWEIVDVSSSLYNNLEEELYQCSNVSPFGIRCSHRAIPVWVDCCRGNFVVSRMDSPFWKDQSKRGFFCSDHFPSPNKRLMR